MKANPGIPRSEVITPPAKVANPDHMRQAISTKFHGATTFKGSRVSARAEPGVIYVGWDHALNVSENHAAAAEAYAKKYGWPGKLYGGGTQTGFVFVFAID